MFPALFKSPTSIAVAAYPAWARRLCGHLFNATPVVAAPIILGLLVAVALVDWLTPGYITFGTAYLVIVAYASWTIGRRTAWGVATAAIGVALLSDGFGSAATLHGHERVVATGWSLTMRLLSSAAIIELTRGFRHSFEHARKIGDTDALTGLPNRRAFGDAAAKSLARVHRGGRTGVLLYADLDGFKLVNDRRGHATGDAVLVEFAEVLKNAVRPGDLICRSGGDEFAAFLDVANEEAARCAVLHLQRVLKSALAKLGHAGLCCSVGAAVAHPGGPLPDIDDLVEQADGLMYQAKQQRFPQLGRLGADR